MIRAENLVKRHGDLQVLRGVTLEVARGDVDVVVGPSGGGKSTFLRCLNGLERFDEGFVEMNGTTLRPGLGRKEEELLLAEIRRHVGMVFQQFHLFPHLSVVQNVMEGPMYVLKRTEEEARERAVSLLDRVGLASKAESRPARLSGGEQQRVAIARTLAMDPQVILFDEPTSALDPKMTDEVLSVMTDLAAGGQTMIVVTHAMGFARRAASRIHVFHEGRVAESGPPEKIFEAAENPVTREFLRKALQ